MPIYGDLNAGRPVDPPFRQRPLDRRHRSAVTPIVLASAFGFLCLIGGTLWGFSIQGSSLGNNIYALSLGTFCAGIAWAVGAGFGVHRVQDASPPTAAGAWVLRAVAIVFIIGAILVARRFLFPTNFLNGLAGDPDVVPLVYDRMLERIPPALEPLRRLMWLDGVIAASTCIALSARNRLQRPAMLVGALATLLVLCLAAVEFSRVLPAWESA